MSTDGDLVRAQGKLILFLASLLQRANIVDMAEFGRLLSVYAAAVAETEPVEGGILATWAAVFDEGGVM
jgi:hypothetical protein